MQTVLVSKNVLVRYRVLIETKSKFGFRRSRRSNCNLHSTLLLTGQWKLSFILANLNKNTLFRMNSLDTKFSCFTLSLTQPHSFFSYCNETKPFIHMQSKVASHVLTANKPANRPFAAYSHMVQKLPCWDARDALGQEKQRTYII